MQYRQWRKAADLAGLSLSAWTSRILDEHAGGYSRLVDALYKHAPSFERGRVPMRRLASILQRRWGWSIEEVHHAAEVLSEHGLLRLHPYSRLDDGVHSSWELLRLADGTLVGAVSLPFRPNPRPGIRFW